MCSNIIDEKKNMCRDVEEEEIVRVRCAGGWEGDGRS